MPLSISKACSQITPSTTLRLNAMVAEMKSKGIDVIGLAAGEPDFDTPDFIKEAAYQAIRSGKTKYTAVSGIPELRKAISAQLQEQKGLSYAANEIIVASGAKQAVMEALYAILSPGDEVLMPAPCWLSYPEMIRMAGGEPVPVETTESQGFVPTLDQLRAKVTSNTKAIILNTPNNPSGAVFPEALLQGIADLAREFDFYIISDEIYEPLVYEGAKHVCIAALNSDAKSRTILISGFSKTYAMTGWRLGFAAGPKAVIAAMDAYQSHASGNPCSISQYAGLAALQGDQSCVSQMAESFARRRKLMLKLLNEIKGLHCFEPSGAFYVMLNVTGCYGKQIDGKTIQNDEDFAELLLQYANVSVVPGAPFYAKDYCRLSYAISDERITQAANRIKTFVESLK